MRVGSTKAEEMLWQQLKGRRIGGAKFRRQVPLKGFILDFVCFEQKLVIEVDGAQHAESQPDLRRDSILKLDGVRVLRFWNEEIEKSLDFAVQRVIVELGK